MKILTLALAIICIAIFSGCMNPIPNKFLTSNNYGFISQCAGIFDFEVDYKIDDSKIYAFKKNVHRTIYIKTEQNFIPTQINAGLAGLVPIESCNDKWCKIYYPCGQKEYFVKKDDIVKRKY